MRSTVRAANYCRLSRTGGRSVERQEQDGRRIADEHGWQVVEVFREWESASEFARKTPAKGGRKEWQRLLEGISAGQFDVVIVWAEDRSNRDLAQGIEFARLCERAGVRLVLPSYDYDLADPEDRNRFYGEVLAAQRETAKMSKRVRRARLEEAETGRRHPGGERPFGERGRRRLPDGRTVPIVSAEQAAAERASIRDAAARVLAGDSLRGIVLDWNGEPGQPPRVPPPVGGRWTTQSLKRMLISPRMAGLREHRGTLYPSTEIEPILSRETWEAVRAVLLDPARRVTAVGGVARHLLSGLVFCGVCGAKLEAYGRNGQRFYRCPAPAAGGRRCIKRLAAPVERIIKLALFDAVESPAWDAQAGELPPDDPARSHREALARITGELDVLDGMLAEAELAERQGRAPKPSAATLRRKLAERERERDQHQAAVLRLQRGRTIAAIPRNLHAVWDDLSLDRQRNILKALLKLPPEGKGIVIRPQGRGKPFDPETIDPDWRV
jgi:site-specific DNA recombinase